MTQRAKLRRFAFIDLPSSPRGSRPYSLGSPQGSTLSRLDYNLGAAGVDAKGTIRDYLPHPGGIPVRIMVAASVSFRVVKAFAQLSARIPGPDSRDCGVAAPVRFESGPR